MSNQRSGSPATSSHVQNTHALHDESERPANQDDETLRESENSFATQTSPHDSHNSSNNAEHKLSLKADVPPSSDRLSLGLTTAAENMYETRTALIRLARAITTDSDIELGLLDGLRYTLHGTSIDPPVTESTLSELNLERIRFDARLRHDLNFDSNVSFRPNYDGERGRSKKELAQTYWAVLAVELGYFMRLGLGLDSGKIQARLIMVGMTWRLRHMFATIRAILLTLVQNKDAGSVLRVLDVDLLMQQLDHGVCDLVGLGEWLGTIIKSSCSPVRDAAATSVVVNIRNSVLESNPIGLASTIEQLFSVLETMKLDVANHQIRGLRIKMVSDTVRCSREYFRKQIYDRSRSNLCFVDGAQWFADQTRAYQQHSSRSYPGMGHLETLSRGIVSMIQEYPTYPQRSVSPPSTFAFDMHRLDGYRMSFDILRAYEAIVATFEQLRAIVSQANPRPASKFATLRLILRLQTLDPGFNRTLWSSCCDEDAAPIPEDISIEIVRAAYESISHQSMSQIVDHAKIACVLVCERLDYDTQSGCQIYRDVWTKLEARVLQQVGRMNSMDELDMHNYCERALAPSVGSRPADMATGRGELRCADLATENQAHGQGSDGYEELATNIAHIAVLHWRVWGQMLYEPWLENYPVHTYDSSRVNQGSVYSEGGEQSAMNGDQWLRKSGNCCWSDQGEQIDQDPGESDEDGQSLSY